MLLLLFFARFSVNHLAFHLPLFVYRFVIIVYILCYSSEQTMALGHMQFRSIIYAVHKCFRSAVLIYVMVLGILE